MNNRIRAHFFRISFAFLAVTFVLFFFTMRYAMPERSAGQILRLMAEPALVLVFFAVVASLYLSNKIYVENIRPVRYMVNYLNRLMSGTFTDDLPSTEDEAMLSSLLENEEERSLFLKKMADVRQNEVLRRQFSANVSHELKSPLTSINGYAEMIESGMVGPEDTKRFAGIIHREGVRLLNMINEVIQLSKFDTGYSDFDRRESFDLGEVIREQVEALKAMAADRSVWIEVDAGTPQNPVILFGNRRLITDVVRNLLSNAIKYSKADGGTVRLSARREGLKVILVVADDGIGIAPEFQERVFERFFVVDPARSRSEGSGTGLGLSLVKHIMEVHGGTLRLDSELGKGSTFTLTFPKDGVFETDPEDQSFDEYKETESCNDCTSPTIQ